MKMIRNEKVKKKLVIWSKNLKDKNKYIKKTENLRSVMNIFSCQNDNFFFKLKKIRRKFLKKLIFVDLD